MRKMDATFYCHYAIPVLKQEWRQGESGDSRMQQPFLAYPAVLFIGNLTMTVRQHHSETKTEENLMDVACTACCIMQVGKSLLQGKGNRARGASWFHATVQPHTLLRDDTRLLMLRLSYPNKIVLS